MIGHNSNMITLNDVIDRGGSKTIARSQRCQDRTNVTIQGFCRGLVQILFMVVLLVVVVLGRGGQGGRGVVR